MRGKKKKLLKLQQRANDLSQQRLRLDGVGESDLIKRLMEEFPNASPTKAFELALQLEKLIKGDLSLLDDPEMAQRLAKLRAGMDRHERDAKRFEEDRQGFMERTLELGQKHTPVGDELERERAKGVKMFEEALKVRVGERAVNEMKLEEMVRNGKQVTILIPGTPVMVGRGENKRMVIEPQVINILHLRWVFPPGQHKVPEVVARRWYAIKKNKDEAEARKAAMKSDLEYGELQKQMKKIDEQYDSQMESPILLP
jgi:hypothetical protein